MRALIVVLCGALVASCSGKAASTAPGGEQPKSVIATRAFRHEQHLTAALNLKCETCHAPKNEFETARPGSAEHAPCDGCHHDQFKAAGGDFCLVCHESADARHPKKSPLHPYPRHLLAAQLVSAFDHKGHLERKTENGDQLTCMSCHAIQGAFATIPSHQECAPCHAGKTEPKLTKCEGCHSREAPGTARRFVTNDIRFTHEHHVKALSGEKIACLFCHQAVPLSSKAEDLNLPRMRECATCHANAQKVPPEKRIDQCGLCHLKNVKSKDTPVNHAMTNALPE